MKAISLWQPWASGLVGGSKDNETRSWRPPAFLIGKTIGIHASKRWQREEREWAETLAYNGFRLGFEGTPPLGCIGNSPIKRAAAANDGPKVSLTTGLSVADGIDNVFSKLILPARFDRHKAITNKKNGPTASGRAQSNFLRQLQD